MQAVGNALGIQFRIVVFLLYDFLYLLRQIGVFLCFFLTVIFADHSKSFFESPVNLGKIGDLLYMFRQQAFFLCKKIGMQVF